MKAITYYQYGSPEVLKETQVLKPTPNENEVLIKLHATAVNSGDLRLRKADPFAVRFFFGLTKPKKNILGGVFSGEIEAIGSKVKKFKVGDQVFGSTGMSFGSYAEYKCINENAIMTIKPSNLNHREAAVIPFGGNTALHFIKKANIKSGQKVLINGASGAVGTSAIQLAKYYGANVTGVCSGSNIELVKSLGADKVIDYTKEDFTKNGEVYDVIFDTVDKISFSGSLKSLTKNGTLILGASGLAGMFQALWSSITSKKKVIIGVINENIEGIELIKKLIEEGKYSPVIDRTYTLDQISAAHSYAELGHKKGNIAIEIVRNSVS